MTFNNIFYENYELVLFNLSLAYPYNDIYNVSTGTVLASNVDNFTITLVPNQQIIVGNYTDKSGPPNGNHAPTVSVSISSVTNTTISNITCQAVIADQDYNLMNLSVTWINNSQQTSTDFNNSYPSMTFNATKSNDSLAIGDNWSCEVNVTDGNLTAASTSSIITITEIVNLPPGAPTVTLTTSLNCSTTISDLNNDLLNVTMIWFKDGILNSTNTTEQPSGTYVSEKMSYAQANWTCIINVSDGQYTSTGNASREVLIDTLPPNIQITPSSGYSTTAGYIIFTWNVSESAICNITINSVIHRSNLSYPSTYSQSSEIDVGAYTWNMTCIDASNNTNYTQTNSFTMAAAPIIVSTPSGGGGGGGGAAIPRNITENVTINATIDQTVKQENVAIELNETENERKNDSGAVTEHAAIAESDSTETAVKEERPTMLTSSTFKSSLKYVYFALGIIVLAISLNFLKKEQTHEKKKTFSQLKTYMKQAIEYGYSYQAVQAALKKRGYMRFMIEKAVSDLEAEGIKPRKRKAKTARSTPESITKLSIYIKRQLDEGYEIEDIADVLMDYGHSHESILEAVKGV